MLQHHEIAQFYEFHQRFLRIYSAILVRERGYLGWKSSFRPALHPHLEAQGINTNQKIAAGQNCCLARDYIGGKLWSCVLIWLALGTPKGVDWNERWNDCTALCAKSRRCESDFKSGSILKIDTFAREMSSERERASDSEPESQISNNPCIGNGQIMDSLFSLGYSAASRARPPGAKAFAFSWCRVQPCIISVRQQLHQLRPRRTTSQS